MKLIVGLGNLGDKYLWTRHNIGFMVIDSLADTTPFQKKHSSLIQKTKITHQDILLAKPQTYMNLSGQAVQQISHYYKIPLEDILVIQDDKDLPFLAIKFQKSRGHGGHNGIKNIHERLGSNDYVRLKLGVGNAKEEVSTPTYDFVLSAFTQNEKQELPHFLKKSCEAVRCFVEKGFELASNEFNQKKEE